MILELLAVLLFAGLVVACLTWDTLMSWFASNKSSISDYGEIVAEKLNNGNYSVVAGVFDKRRKNLSQQTWEASELDSELSSRLGGRSRLRVEI